ncbi:PAAR domain-containing protein [Piscirickettsia litoralis]|uniref:PAAR domain-containing protein n=1 Tax=Piscirickettsia litoralis TaxID=1891921 RepID=UPI0022860392|nr:PAAR domain-containing protein [Piscirickettsia litoralis]
MGTVSGHIAAGSPNVFINKRPAARVKDPGRYCIAVTNRVTEGAQTVFINGKPAAKKTSSMSLSGRVTDGSDSVFIG